MLDAMIASALKKLLNTQSNFSQKVKCRRAPSSEGLPIFYEEHKLRTRFTSISVQPELMKEAVQGLSTLFAVSLKSDDVQEFYVRCDHASLSVSDMPSDMILEGLYKSKISDCDAIVQSRNGPNQGAELSQIEDICWTSYWSDYENSELQGPERCCGTRISHQESKRKESLRWEDSRRVFPVEGARTTFQRRFMQFQSWHPSF